MSNPQAVGYRTETGEFRGFYIHWGLDGMTGLHSAGFDSSLAETIDTAHGIQRFVERGIREGGYSSVTEMLDGDGYGEAERVLSDDPEQETYVSHIWELTKMAPSEFEEYIELTDNEDDLNDFLDESGYAAVLPNGIAITGKNLDSIRARRARKQ